MNGGSNIRGIRPTDSDAADTGVAEALPMSEPLTEMTADLADPAETFDSDQDMPSRGPGGAIASIAIIAGLAWIGVMLWLNAPLLGTAMTPPALLQFVAALCVPLILIAVLGLILLRTSRAEAQRFGATARAMRAEAAMLERAVATMTRALEENRAALANQTSDLMAQGDHASERLTAVSNAMAQEARQLDQHSRLLVDTAASTEKSLSVVLASVPRAQTETAAMKDAIDSAGLAAGQHTAALAAQLAEVTERGREANQVAGGAAERLAAHIARMEATSETAGARLEAVTASMSAAIDDVLASAADAVDEARKGITAQGDAMLAMISTNQAAIERAGAEGTAALAERITAIEDAIDRIATRLGEQRGQSDTLFTAITAGASDAETRIETLHRDGIHKMLSLESTLTALDQRAVAMTETLAGGDDAAHRVIATAEKLLTALDAAGREMDDTMPETLARLEARIGETRSVIGNVRPEMLALFTAAEGTHDTVEAIAGVIASQREALSALSASLLDSLSNSRDKIGELQTLTEATIASTQRFADDSAPQLVEALVRVRETATVASDHARNTLARVIPEAAQRIERESADALGRAVDDSVNRQIEELAKTADTAVASATRASERLTQQMLAIAETTAGIESRIDLAREAQEASNQDHFGRHVSLLVEALNSASIDIARALSQDVSDSAWSAYLKGDRGIFTRRAVRLIDNGQAREIAGLYDADDGFREQVNRYIHDFEAMLRQILTLRDGSALSVTLLSSDMGKLYVVLAQAIERLRG